MINPNEDRVILKAVPPETKTASGLIVPVEAQKVELWEVVAIGPSCHNLCKECRTKIANELKIGMIVLININAGMDINYENEDLRIIRYSDIHAYDHKK